MELCRSVPDIDERRCPAASIRTVGNVQCAALDGVSRFLVANAVGQFPAVGTGPSANAALAKRRMFRSDGERFALGAERGAGTSRAPCAVILDGRTLQFTCASGPRAITSASRNARRSVLRCLRYAYTSFMPLRLCRVPNALQ